MVWYINSEINFAIYVLKGYLQNEEIVISPALSTKSIEDELQRKEIDESFKNLLKNEKSLFFQTVQKMFHVIEENTGLVVIDEEIKEELRAGQCDWKKIQRKTVPMQQKWIDKLELEQLVEGIYDYDRDYDDFLGIMAGIVSYKGI